jgi:hypothetical protein
MIDHANAINIKRFMEASSKKSKLSDNKESEPRICAKVNSMKK